MGAPCDGANSADKVADTQGPGPHDIPQPLFGAGTHPPVMPIRTLFSALAAQTKAYETASSSDSETAAATLRDSGCGKPLDSPPDPGRTSSWSSKMEADGTCDPCDSASPSSWSVIDADSFSSKGRLSSTGPSTDETSDHAEEEERVCQAGIQCEGCPGAKPSRGEGLAVASSSSCHVRDHLVIGLSSGHDVLDRLAAVREDPTQPSVEKLPLFHLIPLQRRSFYYVLSNVMFVGIWVGYGIMLGNHRV